MSVSFITKKRNARQISLIHHQDNIKPSIIRYETTKWELPSVQQPKGVRSGFFFMLLIETSAPSCGSSVNSHYRVSGEAVNAERELRLSLFRMLESSNPFTWGHSQRGSCKPRATPGHPSKAATKQICSLKIHYLLWLWNVKNSALSVPKET